MSVRAVLFNKPYGVVCQFTPLDRHPTLADYGIAPGLYAAGRLDHDSEGLLLLTSDGALQSLLTEPRYRHPRTYQTQVERIPGSEALNSLRRGIVLKDGKTRPCTVTMLDAEPLFPPRSPPIRFRKAVPTAWLELTLTEGKNRQVRRMTAHVGHPTLRLVRVRIGALTLEGLAPGAWRPLSVAEIRALRSLAASD